MRVLIFHGYLLAGTGSNVYNARLAEALRRMGHDVHLVCQERHPAEHSFIDAAGDWNEGELHVRELPGRDAAAGRCTVYRPEIGRILPVYVPDRYEGLEARTFALLTDAEIADYVDANVAAVREVAGRTGPDLALANHLVMGPLIVARALAGTVPYAVKVHGSALEYTVKPEPERFLVAARRGVAGAACVLVGSRHTAESLWAALGDEELPVRTRLGPPGVDVVRFAPRQPRRAADGVRALAAALAAQRGRPAGEEASSFDRDAREAAEAIGRLEPERDVLVAFVGKLIVSKGVDLLLAAWPLVLAAQPAARLVVVGFGAYRAGLERLVDALAAGDLAAARELAFAGRQVEDPARPAVPLGHLLAFLESLRGPAREDFLRAAAALHETVVFTGRLEHDELAELLPACSALVVPSTFPEAFGMVAAEAAACGALPVSAAHSGLAEVSRELARAVPAAADWLSFPIDDHAVEAIAQRLRGWLDAPEDLRASARTDLVGAVRARWSWERVAEGVLAAARGELAALAAP